MKKTKADRQFEEVVALCQAAQGIAEKVIGQRDRLREAAGDVLVSLGKRKFVSADKTARLWSAFRGAQ